MTAFSPAELVVIDATVYTGKPGQGPVDAMAVSRGRVVALGKAARQMIGPATRVLRLPGKTVLPGFIDSHGHLAGLGESLEILDLRGARTVEEIIELVRQAARSTAPGSWIRGRGWDQNRWPEKRFPTATVLDQATTDHPVLLSRVDGHACWVNSAALHLARIDARTPDPPGGKILRLPDGTPTGVLLDRAQELVTQQIPPPTERQIEERLLRAANWCARLGLTMVHDAGVDQRTLQCYERLAQAGRLPIRVYAMVQAPGPGWDRLLAEGPKVTGLLTVRAAKLVADGALGSRGAALLEDYSDEPGNRGLLLLQPAEIKELARQAVRAGLQLATHAIGDRANRLVLNAYEAATIRNRSLRFRIEHAQVIQPADIARFGLLHIIASVQPYHAVSDMAWAPQRLGEERLAGAYAWRKLLSAGAILACGSDFPVEDPNPLLGFYAAVTRQDLKGQPPGGWFPAERLTREEALRCYTWAGAYAAFSENELGELTPGKIADFVVLSDDILKIPAQEIPRTRVLMTFVGGNLVYSAP